MTQENPSPESDTPPSSPPPDFADESPAETLAQPLPPPLKHDPAKTQFWLLLLEDGAFPRVLGTDTQEELVVRLTEICASDWSGHVYVFHGQRWVLTAADRPPRHLLTPEGAIPLAPPPAEFVPDLSGAVGHPQLVAEDFRLQIAEIAQQASEESLDVGWADGESESGELADDEDEDEENFFGK